MLRAPRVLECLLIAAALSALIACKKYDPLYCDDDHPCEDPERPFCDREGIHPGSEGLANTCVPYPFDAGVTEDASGTPADAGTTDGQETSDARPPSVPVVTGQAADVVLGQPDFESTMGNNGGLTSRSLAWPSHIATTDGRLWVADAANARVMQWNSLPNLDFAAADIAIGQLSLSSKGEGPTREILSGVFGPYQFMGVAVADGRIAASDPEANRVLLWDALPTGSGAQADVVLGQSEFTSGGTTTSATATSLNDPAGLWTDGLRLAVADASFNRVLLWNTWPTSNAQAPDVVLGQPDFTSKGGPTPPTASTMALPTDVFFDGSRLFVVDTGNNRVMVWNGWPTQNNSPADYFVGQSSGATGNTNAGGAAPNAIGLDFPAAVAVAHESLFVADSQNNRVVVYTPVPTDSGVEASAVLGQQELTASDSSSGAAGLSQPRGLSIANDSLFVSDWENNRVLVFTLSP